MVMARLRVVDHEPVVVEYHRGMEFFEDTSYAATDELLSTVRYIGHAKCSDMSPYGPDGTSPVAGDLLEKDRKLARGIVVKGTKYSWYSTLAAIELKLGADDVDRSGGDQVQFLLQLTPHGFGSWHEKVWCVLAAAHQGCQSIEVLHVQLPAYPRQPSVIHAMATLVKDHLKACSHLLHRGMCKSHICQIRGLHGNFDH
jgi:hypothetical protein